MTESLLSKKFSSHEMQWLSESEKPKDEGNKKNDITKIIKIE
jgi:hypothetical protein